MPRSGTRSPSSRARSAGRCGRSGRADRAGRVGRTQNAAQPLVMRAPPEDAPAIRAFGKGFLRPPHLFRHAPADGLSGDFAQRRVAHPATGERLEQALELKLAYYFAELLLRFRFAHEVPALDR